MITKTAFATLAVAGLALALATARPATAQPGDGYGPGWMMGGGGYGPGMMGGCGPGGMHGYGRGGYGPGYGPGGYAQGARTDLHLTVPQVTQRMDAWLKAIGNPNITLGPVVEKNMNTITAEVVTKQKNALVQRYDINRHTGAVTPDDTTGAATAAGK